MEKNMNELNPVEMADIAGGAGTPAGYVTYIVKKGDTLYKIAGIYGVTVDDLVRWNGIKNRNLIYPGQELKIYL